MIQNSMMIITSVADIRTEPKFESERDSQLIYGEFVDLLENLGEWSKVRCVDGVVGYVKTALIGEERPRKYKLNSMYRNEKMALPFGSYVDDKDVEYFGIPSGLLEPIDGVFNPLDLYKNFMGVPYLWGGTSDFGFDCSGFTQRLFRYSGKEIPRNSSQQRDASSTIRDFEAAEPGDLVFFKGHVALYLGNGLIVHANGRYSRVTVNNLFDGSEYAKLLMSIFEKIGRFNVPWKC